MKAPSTDWREIVAADEAERFARQSEAIKRAHGLKSAKHGKGRFLHRKPVLAARATLKVYPDLPDFARHGLFAEPKDYAAIVRLSNGSLDLQANTQPDIRGFAIKVMDISGPSSLSGTTDHQDFLAINQDGFAARTSREFVDLAVVMAERGQLGVLWHFIRTYGILQALQRLKTLSATTSRPFKGYFGEHFTTATAFAVGPFAAKLKISPVNPAPSTSKDYGEDIKALLQNGPLVYDLALQFFVDETITPIEDPTVIWPESQSPYVRVAALTLTAQADAEQLFFDPWGGLMEHRPLGEINRARKSAYFTSQNARRP